MGLTAIRGGFMWPERAWEAANNTSRLLDASGEQIAHLITFTSAATIKKIRFRTGAIPTGDTLRVSLQDINSSTGDPDGGVDQYRTITLAGGDANAWQLTGLITSDGTDGGSKRSVAAGDSLYVVIDYSSYAAGAINILDSTTGQAIHNGNYSGHYTGSWTKLVTWGCIEVIDDSDTVLLCIGAIPALNSSSTAINNTSGVREQGNYFRLPFACRAGGMFAAIDADADFEAILYDSDGATKLGSVSMDKDQRQQTSAANTLMRFDAEATLAANTWYRMVVKPTTATSITFRQMDMAGPSGADGMPGGQNCHWTERSSGGAWTQKDDRIGKIWLWVTAVHDGSGGGGGHVIGG